MGDRRDSWNASTQFVGSQPLTALTRVIAREEVFPKRGNVGAPIVGRPVRARRGYPRLGLRDGVLHHAHGERQLIWFRRDNSSEA